MVACQTPLTPAVCLHTLNWAPVRVCVTLSSQQVCQCNYNYSNYDSTDVTIPTLKAEIEVQPPEYVVLRVVQ